MNQTLQTNILPVFVKLKYLLSQANNNNNNKKKTKRLIDELVNESMTLDSYLTESAKERGLSPRSDLYALRPLLNATNA